jgi:DNA-binding NarL/FixJ family response regulator
MQPNKMTLSPRQVVSQFTPRQLEIFQLLTQGYSNKQIGLILGISRATVKRHVSDVCKRTGIENRVQLICSVAIWQYEKQRTQYVPE